MEREIGIVSCHSRENGIQRSVNPVTGGKENMPDEKQWNCNRFASFLAEVEDFFKERGLGVIAARAWFVDQFENHDACRGPDDVFKKYGLDTAAGKEKQLEHIDGCGVCEQAGERFEEKYGPF